MVRTPCEARPTRRICTGCTRITIPEDEITNMSWSFDPTNAPDSPPVRFVSLCTATPFVGRPFRGYCSIAVRFPKPFSVTVIRSSPEVASTIARTSAPGVSFMPMTPAVCRPIGRAAACENRAASPALEISMRSPFPSVSRTSTSSSPGLRLIAASPVRGESYSVSAVRFTIPFLVAKTRNLPS
jgi:hypothetical protein